MLDKQPKFSLEMTRYNKRVLMVRAKKDSHLVYQVRSKVVGKSGRKSHHLECIQLQVTETQLKEWVTQPEVQGYNGL